MQVNGISNAGLQSGGATQPGGTQGTQGNQSGSNPPSLSPNTVTYGHRTMPAPQQPQSIQDFLKQIGTSSSSGSSGP